MLVMLYDRFLISLDGADAAIGNGALPVAHTHLIRAQEIVDALAAAVDTDAWPGGHGILDLYRFIDQQLIDANLAKGRTPGRAVQAIASCREIMAPLAETWREAMIATSPAPSAGAAAVLRDGVSV